MKTLLFIPLAAAVLGIGFGSGYGIMAVADPSPPITIPRPAVTVTKSTVRLLPGPAVTAGGADIPGVVTPYSSPVYHVTRSASPRAARSPEPARTAPSPGPEVDLSPSQSPSQSPSPVVTFTPSSAPVLGVPG